MVARPAAARGTAAEVSTVVVVPRSLTGGGALAEGQPENLPCAGAPTFTEHPTAERLTAARLAMIACSVVLALGLVAALTGWAADNGRETTAAGGVTGGRTVAVVADLDWIAVGRLSSASEYRIGTTDESTVMLTSGKADEHVGRSVYVAVSQDALPTWEEPPGTPVVAGALTGFGGVDEFSGHTWLMVGRGERYVSLWAGPGVNLDHLVTIATGLDLARPMTDQQLAQGWRVLTTARAALDGSTLREFDIANPERNADMTVTSRTGAGDAALWFIGGATVSRPTEIRGGPGLVASRPGTDEVVLTWLEEPGLVVQMTYRSTSTEREQDALEVADGLRVVDTNGWREFASSATRWAQETSPPEQENTNTASAEVVREGQLSDGRRFRLEERGRTVLCVVVDGIPPLSSCDPTPGHRRGQIASAQPRMMVPGSFTGTQQALLVYGYLPTRTLGGDFGFVQNVLGPEFAVGRATSVEIRDSRGRDWGQAAITEGVWHTVIPDPELGLVVTYRFLDGTSLTVEPSRERAEEDPANAS